MRLVVNFENTGNVTVQPNVDCVINKDNVKITEITNKRQMLSLRHKRIYKPNGQQQLTTR